MDGTPSDTFWIATLTFDSMEDMQKSLESPEGQGP